MKSKYYKNQKEVDEINNIEFQKQNDIGKKTINYVNYNKKNERIEKIIEKMKNIGKFDENTKDFYSISEFVENKKKVFDKVVKKTHLQFLTMSKEELQIYSKTFSEQIEKIENFINYYVGNIDNIRKFDPVQEKMVEIKDKLKRLNNKIIKLNYKYQNNNIVFENGDKVIQRLKNENYLLRKKIYEYDKKYIYSTLSPSTHYNKFKTRNFLHKHYMNSILNNYNYNTILTTATSNEMTGQSNIPSSSKALMEKTTRRTIDINELHHINFKQNIFEKRPISSFNKLSPYYIVAGNL